MQYRGVGGGGKFANMGGWGGGLVSLVRWGVGGVFEL